MALSTAQILAYVQLGQSLDCLDILVNTDGDSQDVAMRKIARAQDISMNSLTRGTTAERGMMESNGIAIGSNFFDTDLELWLKWNGSAWVTDDNFDVSTL